MLFQAKTLMSYGLTSLDGEIGKAKDFYFDDHLWVIRYMVADTGEWLVSREVLISPYALSAVLKHERRISVELTKEQIEKSPSLDSDKPVSRQYETDYNLYYGWPMYWSGDNLWGVYPYMWGADPYALRDDEKRLEAKQDEKKWNPHLRSAQEVTGYHVHASDGEIGHIDDLIVDDETWAIRYAIVDTQNWWPGKSVLLSPQWIERVSWEESMVFVDLPSETIKQSPEYTERSLLTREYECILHRNYGRKGYWDHEPPAL